MNQPKYQIIGVSSYKTTGLEIGSEVVGGIPNAFLYTDATGVITSDPDAVRDGVTKETYFRMPVYAVGTINDGVSQEVNWRADNAGGGGNAITLVFDGVDDTDTVLAAWNAANPSNTASVVSGTGNFVPSADTIILSGGGDAGFISSIDFFGQGYQAAGNFYSDNSDKVSYNGLLNTSDGMYPFILSNDFATGELSIAQLFPGNIQLRADLNSGDASVLKLDTYDRASIMFNSSTYGQSGVAAFYTGQLHLFAMNYEWNWAMTDGSNGDVLTTDGSGNLSFATATGGLTGYTDNQNTALGIDTAATSVGQYNTFIGNGAGYNVGITASSRNTLIGQDVIGTSTIGGPYEATNVTFVGQQISINGDVSNTVAMGHGINFGSVTDASVVIGTNASGANYSVAIGNQASNVGHQNSIAIGNEAINTSSSQMVVGSNTSVISDFYFGNGVVNSSGLPNSTNFHATGGSGTDKAGGLFTIHGGQSTGTGAGGDIRFLVSPASVGSSSTDNAFHNFIQLGANKISTFGDVDLAYHGLILEIDNQAGGISLGNTGGAGGNGTHIGISDSAQTITATAGSGFLVEATSGGNQWFNVAPAAGVVQIGDLSGGNGTLEVNSTGTGSINITKPLKLQGYTVATLPTGAVGQTAYVTDALAPAFGVAVAGSGAVTIPVFYDGAAWIVG